MVSVRETVKGCPPPCTKVDIGFLYGNLHHRGGIVFSLVSLSILIGCLALLQKLEGSGPIPEASRRG